MRKEKGTQLQFHPATASHWADIEELFGERGACGGCWCMFWRVPRKQYEADKGARNKRAFQKIVKSGRKPGIVAYMNEEPIGWCAVAPREDYTGLATSRLLKAIDDKPVWTISCLFVKKPYRRQGISAMLLEAATKFARSQGAKIVEGYPVETSMEQMPDPFLWHGTTSAFKSAGFTEVLRRSPARPIMRLRLG